MSSIESPNPTLRAGLTREIQNFWTQHVNAERILGKEVTQHARPMFHAFGKVEIKLDYADGEGYGKLFSLTPRWLYDWLSRRFGWHLMIVATK